MLTRDYFKAEECFREAVSISPVHLPRCDVEDESMTSDAKAHYLSETDSPLICLIE